MRESDFWDAIRRAALGLLATMTKRSVSAISVQDARLEVRAHLGAVRAALEKSDETATT